jgi:hypothetical protein
VLETARTKFLFRVSPSARAFLLREGTDFKYGARHLKRAIEREVVYPMANLLATGQVGLGDEISVDWDESSQKLVFAREREHAFLPTLEPEPASVYAHAAPIPVAQTEDTLSPITASELKRWRARKAHRNLNLNPEQTNREIAG